MDRFAELKGGGSGAGAGGRGDDGGASEARGLVSSGDVRADVPGDGGDSVFMAQFFEQVGVVRGELARVRRNVTQVAEEHRRALATVMTDTQAAEHEAKVDALMADTSALSHTVQARLKRMERENETFAASADATPSEVAIRKNLLSTLSRKFVATMSEYQEVQSSYKGKLKERVERQVRIVKPDATPQELEQAVRGDAGSVFRAEIVHGGAQHSAAKNALLDIQSKNADIKKLEASILELQQLFNDMAVLVEAQGELLDSIEHNVNLAVRHVEKGVEEIQKARKLQKSSRKLMCCLVILFIGIGIAIAIPVIATKKGKSKDA
eukprot:TRINITY_DN2119_c2_g1_i1.p1 TRINITY_DN2119_c2_g1~~TRINITY_DN2119_c2_g1_i1.p1  ORF type:complete len:323 (+),score=152.09 TRINITY_DN2119_c2_g1_i1:96-1064(+)